MLPPADPACGCAQQMAEFHRLVDEDGRLLTSREAKKMGLSRFTKKKKGKNSLARRCTCGNKLPCDGDVMITKNEHGKLEYHKIPRYWVGHAHAYETRQPAQYTVTPSNANLTDLFAHLSPLLLEQVAEMTGMPPEEAHALGDAAARNATLNPRSSGLACYTCNSTDHMYIDCPWVTHLTRKQTRKMQWELGQLKRRALQLNASGDPHGELGDVEQQIEHIGTVLWAQEDYPELDLVVGNTTYHYNQPGTNEELGQVTLRDLEKAIDTLPPPPPGGFVRVPQDFADMEKATRGAADGQTVLVPAGETRWYEQAWVEALDDSYVCSPAAATANKTHRVLHFRPEPAALPAAAAADGEHTSEVADSDVDMQASSPGEQTLALSAGGGVTGRESAWRAMRAAWRRGKYAHTLVSVAGVEYGAQEHNLTTTFYFMNAALLHGRWYLLPESSGSFANVSCYSRHGGVPGEHSTRSHFPHEDEITELSERLRPRSLTDDCFMILGGPWLFEHCDIVCYDGTAVAICDEDAHVEMVQCTVGAAGFAGRLANGTWALDHCEGRAHVAIEMEGHSYLTLQGCLVQLTDYAGVRMGDAAQARMHDCRFEHNGLAGGAAIKLATAAQAWVSRSTVVCGKSVSPAFPRVAAFEAEVSARSQARLHVSDSHVRGRLWLQQHRPRHLSLANVTAEEPAEHSDLGGTVRDGRALALADGVLDPVLLWRTSHQEIWWSKKRLDEIGLDHVDYPEDAHGQIRCVPEQELFFQDTPAEDDVLWANRSKSIRLHSWGWEGSLADAFDTESAAVMSLHQGFWQPWHDLDQQLYYRQRCRFKALFPTHPSFPHIPCVSFPHIPSTACHCVPPFFLVFPLLFSNSSPGLTDQTCCALH